MSKPDVIDPILISNFIHQVINPLNGIVGTIDNLIDGTIDQEHHQQRLTAVRGQLAHSIEIIRNLAFLSQLYSTLGIESLTEKSQPVRIPRLIIESIQFFQESARKKNIKVELVDRITQYEVFGHQHLLKQVIVNIIDNGIKYGDRSTKITIEPHVQKNTNNLLVDIRSYGPGFYYDERNKLFELGFRGKDAQSMKASGSGIGLYISKRIIELVHRGVIEAEYSRRTRETLFRLRFPEYTIKERE